tara:strand:- start:324 stop:608 length:285 start_codon:yes stop_codon:yes gene_type:complete
MAQTLPDIVIGQTWVDINTISEIGVGTAFRITNKGSGEILVLEQTATPSDSVTLGTPVTNTNRPYAIANILTGSLKIWCKARYVLGTTITVHEV